MMRWTMPAALLMLAACGDKDKPTPAPEDQASVAPLPEAAPAAPSTAADAPPAADYRPDPAVTPPSTAESGIGSGNKAIPAAIQGRWALTAGDCTKHPGTDLTALAIDAANLRFHESHGELARVRERSANRVVADYKFSGEGVEWDRLMLLQVENDGKTLVRRDYGEGSATETLRYTRCAA